MFIAGAPELAVHSTAIAEIPRATVTPTDQHALKVHHFKLFLACSQCLPCKLHVQDRQLHDMSSNDAATLSASYMRPHHKHTVQQQRWSSSATQYNQAYDRVSIW